MSQPDAAVMVGRAAATETSVEPVLHARELVVALESGDDQRAGVLLDELTRIRESDLFRELGHITRQLHQSLTNMQLDEQVSVFTHQHFPDAKQRLDYVMAKTEEAANRTLTAVESALPAVDDLSGEAERVADLWARHRAGEPVDQDALGESVEAFLSLVAARSSTIGSSLSEVLLAQDFQDLTGQVLKRVIDLVQEVEDHLVHLIRLRGTAPGAAAAVGLEDPENGCGPAITNPGDGSVMAGQDDVDDLLSQMGF